MLCKGAVQRGPGLGIDGLVRSRPRTFGPGMLVSGVIVDAIAFSPCNGVAAKSMPGARERL